jgi:3-methyladenine DNA glycosylase AlkD
MQRRLQLEAELQAAGDPERAKGLAWFFKTGKGQYGEGDCFLGIRVPVQRKIALRFQDLSLLDIAKLLASPYHECRFTALEILVAQYESSPSAEIFRFYLQNTSGINNWDLVDTSAPYIVGAHLLTRKRKILDKLAASENLWERRIAIVSTLRLIKDRQLDDTFRIARKLLPDRHDLTHKAVGWALRETGRQSRAALVEFLRVNYTLLPRTALRYAIEHFSPAQRKHLLAGNFDVLLED